MTIHVVPDFGFGMNTKLPGMYMETIASDSNSGLPNPQIGCMAEEQDRDWHTYRGACREISEKQGLDDQQILARKQACALAYLGKRSHGEGSAYSRTRVRILTPDFVQSMARNNTAQRHQRYPWLERLLASMEETGKGPDRIALGGKVLSMMAHKHASRITPAANA